MKHESKPPVTLEDLLRVKRAERPAPEFWEDFDRQLRAKQLAALVGRRPWWRDLPRFVSSLSRHHLSIGATVTVLAISLVIWDARETDHFGKSSISQSMAAVAGAGTAQEREFKREGGGAATVMGDTHAVAAMDAALDRDAMGRAGAAGGDDAPAQAVVDAGSVWRGGISTASSSTPRYVEASLLGAGGVGGVRDFMGSANRFEGRAAASRMVVEPLTQVALPHDRRGSRLMTAMVSATSAEKAMRVAERAASRLSEEQLYDQIRRFGARGAGVNVKF